MAEQGLRINPVFEIESREGVWKAVERGLGISVVADFEFVPHSNLRTLEIRDRVIQTQYSIAYHRDRAHSPIIKAFIDTVSRMKDGPRKFRRSSGVPGAGNAFRSDETLRNSPQSSRVKITAAS